MCKQQKDNGNYFKVPNAIFHLGLHRTAIAIYAYLMCIEDRRTYQCIASYPTIAGKLGIAVNTVAKYVRTLEERGLIRTERTEFVTRDGRKRNGCLRYHILPFRQALDRHNERRITTARQKAKAKAEKLGIGFIPADGKQSAWPPRVGPCGPLCTPLRGWVDSQPPIGESGAILGRCTMAVHLSAICTITPIFAAKMGGRKWCRIKQVVACDLPASHIAPQCGSGMPENSGLAAI